MKRNRKIQTTHARILFMVLSSITLIDCLLRCILGHNIVEMLLHQIVPVVLGLKVPFDMQFPRFHLLVGLCASGWHLCLPCFFLHRHPFSFLVPVEGGQKIVLQMTGWASPLGMMG